MPPSPAAVSRTRMNVVPRVQGQAASSLCRSADSVYEGSRRGGIENNDSTNGQIAINRQIEVREAE